MVRQSSDGTVTWEKSSRSTYNGNCVQVAATGDRVLVRDSKDPGAAVLSFTAAEWREFLGSLGR